LARRSREPAQSAAAGGARRRAGRRRPPVDGRVAHPARAAQAHLRESVMKSQENVLPLDSPGRTLVRSNRNVGTILVDEDKLTAAEADKVMLLQQSHGMRFGEAAMHLRLISQEDLQRALAKQYDFHYLEPGTEDVSPEVLAAFNPYHPRVEEMRALRTQLMIRWYNPQTGNRALAIVSPGNQEGRSYVAANLAVLFAQLGHRTLLIDADLRNPRQHLLFNLSDRIGL